jgi:hypothetical protein
MPELSDEVGDPVRLRLLVGVPSQDASRDREGQAKSHTQECEGSHLFLDERSLAISPNQSQESIPNTQMDAVSVAELVSRSTGAGLISTSAGFFISGCRSAY